MVAIFDYVRTGRGKASESGALHHLRALDLVTTLQTALVQRTQIDPERIEDVALGVASQVGEQGADLARPANLLTGWRAPGVPTNPFCASGTDAVAQMPTCISVVPPMAQRTPSMTPTIGLMETLSRPQSPKRS